MMAKRSNLKKGGQHSASSRVPAEILRMIFQHSFPSFALLERSMIKAPEYIWSEEYEVKRTIVGVSKFWRAVGLELLYGEVIIRCVDRLPCLLRTISSPGSDIGPLIQKMMVWCFVPLNDDTTAFEDSVKQIVARCPSLTHLTMHPSFEPLSIFSEHSEPEPQPLWVSDDPLCITHLNWGCNLLLSDLVSLLQQCPNLESLCFHLRLFDDPHYPDDMENALHDSLDLPNLRELRIVRSDRTDTWPTGTVPTSPGTYVDSLLAAQWSMPQLESFTYFNTRSTGFADIVGFCHISGKSLRYLHLGPDWRDWILNDTVQKIIDECPALEHLVLWISQESDLHGMLSLSHSNIMWMDLWVEMTLILKYGDELVRSQGPGLLSLRGIRFFDHRLLRPRAHDLPALLPPRALEYEGQGLEYTYFGLNVMQIGPFIFQSDQTANLILGDSNGSSDDDFDPDTIPSDDDTSERGSSSSDDGMLLSDDEVGESDTTPSYDDTSELGSSSSDDGTLSSDDEAGESDGWEGIREWELDSFRALAVFSVNMATIL